MNPPVTLADTAGVLNPYCFLIQLGGARHVGLARLSLLRLALLVLQSTPPAQPPPERIA